MKANRPHRHPIPYVKGHHRSRAVTHGQKIAELTMTTCVMNHLDLPDMCIIRDTSQAL
jgi:hypothetical protein